MDADYYVADTEDGDHIDDPSEDALFMLLKDLDATENTFVTITPADPEAAWYASVSRLEEGGYEVEYRDPRHREHELTVQTNRSKIAKDLTLWLARRHHPGRPATRHDL
ncbi:hypothetical protein [Actinoallomurus soli]|uniref:hypothetical protein n=1 Tax=Actinoallomurus soli TaxID=2952535 RepID=UPI002092C358|nr:hypothetical protein [Actinoallomurus soli]MCO5970974.1 hypothetical protein [Actinoallomurus soli]